MNKQQIINKIIQLLRIEAENLANAARIAHADATNPESKAENKYDTRSLEASYLAGAQAKMAADAKQNLAAYQNIELKEFTKKSRIALTALIELQADDGTHNFYFLGPKGGGTEIQIDDKKILLITPYSPIGKQLIGREIGDSIEIYAGSVRREYEVVALF